MIVSSSWAVAVAQNNRAFAVSAALKKMEMEHFVPRVEKLAIVRGRHVREYQPLLGNYVLMQVCSRWRDVLRLRDVHGMLLNESGFPAQVLTREVENLRAFCPDEIYNGSTHETDGWCYGAKVYVEKGPFARFIGRYEGKTGKNREAAVFSLFGREQKVTFKRGELILA